MFLLKSVFLVFLITPLDAVCRNKDKNPCKNGGSPLPGYFCGRGPTRQDCPSNYECIIAPNDAYAVCCLSAQPVTKAPTEKPGSCPKPTDAVGICIAKCTYDSDCPGNQKCCGSCPRQCTQPV